MTRAKRLIDHINSLELYNPNDIGKIADFTDELPINRVGIEDQINLIKNILNKNKYGVYSKIQGMSNVGLIKMGLG